MNMQIMARSLLIYRLTGSPALLGTVALVFIPEFFRALQDYRMITYGILMVVIILFMPNGLVGGIRKGWSWLNMAVGKGQ